MRVDHRNNVVYNHGYTSLYGAEWCEGINVVGNYYKPGPDTLAGTARHVIEPYRGGSWYVTGNAVEGHDDVTEDNTLGISYQIVGLAADPSLPPQLAEIVNTGGGGINLLQEPAKISHPMSRTLSAQEAYEAVLADVGATLPYRDAVDVRLINEVRTGTGRISNSQNEVGGYPVIDDGEAPADSDHDGIPDAWETENGLDPNDPADGAAVGTDGYTNLERYLSSITSAVTDYPTVAITSPEPNLVSSARRATQSITVTAEASAVEGAPITAVEFYVNETKIGEATAAPYQATWTAPVGTWYLSARVIDSRGVKVQSSTVPVHVNRTSRTGAWISKDVGAVPLVGSAYRDATTGDFTITGSGKIRGRIDSFQFLYQEIRARPNDTVEIIGRIDSINRPWEGIFAGFMFRETLREDSRYFAGGLQVMGDGLKGHVTRIQSHGPGPSLSSYPWEEDELLDVEPQWIRLIKRGQEFEAHLSGDSLQWTRIGYERIPMRNRIYVGMVADANKQANQIANYAAATFHNVQIRS